MAIAPAPIETIVTPVVQTDTIGRPLNPGRIVELQRIAAEDQENAAVQDRSSRPRSARSEARRAAHKERVLRRQEARYAVDKFVDRNQHERRWFNPNKYLVGMSEALVKYDKALRVANSMRRNGLASATDDFVREAGKTGITQAMRWAGEKLLGRENKTNSAIAEAKSVSEVRLAMQSIAGGSSERMERISETQISQISDLMDNVYEEIINPYLVDHEDMPKRKNGKDGRLSSPTDDEVRDAQTKLAEIIRNNHPEASDLNSREMARAMLLLAREIRTAGIKADNPDNAKQLIEGKLFSTGPVAEMDRIYRERLVLMGAQWSKNIAFAAAGIAMANPATLPAYLTATLGAYMILNYRKLSLERTVRVIDKARGTLQPTPENQGLLRRIWSVDWNKMQSDGTLGTKGDMFAAVLARSGFGAATGAAMYLIGDSVVGEEIGKALGKVGEFIHDSAPGKVVEGALDNAGKAVGDDLAKAGTTVDELMRIAGLEHQTAAVPHCFIAGTLILLADGSSRKIEEIKVGDKVLSYDEKTKEIVVKEVLETVSPVHSVLVKIQFSQNISNTNTPDHPYLTSEKGWVSCDPEATKAKYGLEVGQLEVQDHVYLHKDGKLEEVLVEEITLIHKETQTYNLSHIADTHTYFANGILVHNKSGAMLAAQTPKGQPNPFSRDWQDLGKNLSNLGKEYVNGKDNPIVRTMEMNNDLNAASQDAQNLLFKDVNAWVGQVLGDGLHNAENYLSHLSLGSTPSHSAEVGSYNGKPIDLPVPGLKDTEIKVPPGWHFGTGSHANILYDAPGENQANIVASHFTLDHGQVDFTFDKTYAADHGIVNLQGSMDKLTAEQIHSGADIKYHYNSHGQAVDTKGKVLPAGGKEAYGVTDYTDGKSLTIQSYDSLGDQANALAVNVNGHEYVFQPTGYIGAHGTHPVWHFTPGGKGSVRVLEDGKWITVSSDQACKMLGIKPENLAAWHNSGHPAGVSSDWDYSVGQRVLGHNVTLGHIPMNADGTPIISKDGNVDFQQLAVIRGHNGNISTEYANVYDFSKYVEVSPGAPGPGDIGKIITDWVTHNPGAAVGIAAAVVGSWEALTTFKTFRSAQANQRRALVWATGAAVPQIALLVMGLNPISGAGAVGVGVGALAAHLRNRTRPVPTPVPPPGSSGTGSGTAPTGPGPTGPGGGGPGRPPPLPNTRPFNIGTPANAAALSAVQSAHNPRGLRRAARRLGITDPAELNQAVGAMELGRRFNNVSHIEENMVNLARDPQAARIFATPAQRQRNAELAVVAMGVPEAQRALAADALERAVVIENFIRENNAPGGRGLVGQLLVEELINHLNNEVSPPNPPDPADKISPEIALREAFALTQAMGGNFTQREILAGFQGLDVSPRTLAVVAAEMRYPPTISYNPNNAQERAIAGMNAVEHMIIGRTPQEQLEARIAAAKALRDTFDGTIHLGRTLEDRISAINGALGHISRIDFATRARIAIELEEGDTPAKINAAMSILQPIRLVSGEFRIGDPNELYAVVGQLQSAGIPETEIHANLQNALDTRLPAGVRAGSHVSLRPEENAMIDFSLEPSGAPIADRIRTVLRGLGPTPTPREIFPALYSIYDHLNRNSITLTPNEVRRAMEIYDYTTLSMTDRANMSREFILRISRTGSRVTKEQASLALAMSGLLKYNTSWTNNEYDTVIGVAYVIGQNTTGIDVAELLKTELSLDMDAQKALVGRIVHHSSTLPLPAGQTRQSLLLETVLRVVAPDSIPNDELVEITEELKNVSGGAWGIVDVHDGVQRRWSSAPDFRKNALVEALLITPTRGHSIASEIINTLPSTTSREDYILTVQGILDGGVTPADIISYTKLLTTGIRGDIARTAVTISAGMGITDELEKAQLAVIASGPPNATEAVVVGSILESLSISDDAIRKAMNLVDLPANEKENIVEQVMRNGIVRGRSDPARINETISLAIAIAGYPIPISVKPRAGAPVVGVAYIDELKDKIEAVLLSMGMPPASISAYLSVS